MDKANRKKIEWAFYNYEKLKEESAEIYDTICSSGLIADLTRVGHGSGVGNPTEQKAIRCAEQEKALWCAVVERTYIHYSWTAEGILLKKKYFGRKSRRAIMNELCAPESTYHYWLGRILTTAELWAYEFGLVK